MNSNFRSNIDDVRVEIMRLEDADFFDEGAWLRVLETLSAAGRVSTLADAKRRMETAKQNQMDVNGIVVEYPDVALETMEV